MQGFSHILGLWSPVAPMSPDASLTLLSVFPQLPDSVFLSSVESISSLSSASITGLLSPEQLVPHVPIKKRDNKLISIPALFAVS